MHGVHLSDRRMSEEDLDDFFRTLVDPSGTQGVGFEWKRRGKDETLIVVLARTERYGGANNFRERFGKVIGVSLGNNALSHDPGRRSEPRPRHLGRPHSRCAASRGPAPDRARAGALLPPRRRVRLPSPRRRRQFRSPSDRRETRRTRTRTCRRRDTLIDLNGSFDPELTKWSLWPRIRKAGVLTGAPVPITGGFRLQLGSGHATPFAQGDVVRLRTRPLPASTQSGQLRGDG